MIVLDTHVLLWWIDEPAKLSAKVKKVIETALKNKEVIFASSISVWEIYLLVKKGKLGYLIDIDSWMLKVEDIAFLQFVPIDNRIAAKSVELPDSAGRDPADRMIIATAGTLGATLITADEIIRKYRGVRSIW